MAQANDDVLFDEDIAPDEEPLEWEATDEGIEISLDCTKCAAYQPFTIVWEEILALGAGSKVKNFSRVGSSLHYRHTCTHCLANYRQADYSEKDAKREATSTLIINLAEFDNWNRQALGREKASGKQRRYQQQHQQPVQPQQPQQPQQPPAKQPQPAPQAPTRQAQQPAQQPAQQRQRPRVQLTAADKHEIQAYVRQLAQQGYTKEQIIQARRAFAKELLQTRREEAALRAEEQALRAQQQAAQRQQQARQRQAQRQAPVVQQPAKYRKARTKDNRIVLVNASGQIVKYLT